MKIISVTPLSIPEIKVVNFQRFADSRGYFCETFRLSDVQAAIGEGDFPFCVQANQSFSKAGVIRGLHFQWSPHMGKLVRVLTGRLIELFLDIRVGSPTLGCILGYEIVSAPSSTTDSWVWIPPGFAHGNIFLEDSVIEYLCTGEYSQKNEACITPKCREIDFRLMSDQESKKISDLINSNKSLYSVKDLNGFTFSAWLQQPNAKEFSYGKAR